MDYFSKILHIDFSEDAASIIERLSFVDEKDIILAIPTGAAIFKNPSELKLLKKSIDKSDKNIVLISQDQIGMELARDIGFRVEEEFLELLSPDENSGIEQRYSAGTHSHPKVFDIVTPGVEHKTVPTPRRMEIKQAGPDKEEVEIEIPIRRFEEGIPENEPNPEILFAPRKKEQPATQRQKIKFPSFSITSAIVIFITVSFSAAAIALGTILPKATIAITPKKETIDLNIPAKADVSLSNIDTANNKIPAQIIKTEKSQTMEFSATGRQSGESKAGGKITIYNAFTPPQNQTLVKTTRFETSDGKIFRITEGITVPAAKIENGKTVPGSIEANVVADISGSEYNIGPSEFTIPGFKGSPKFNAFYAKSTSAMAGGSKGDGSVVTAEDMEKAKKTIKETLTESIKNELKEKSLSSLEYSDEATTVEIIEESSSLKVGEAGEKFTVTAKASATTFQFSEEDIKMLIAKNIEEKTTTEKIIFKDLTKKYSDITADFSNGILTLNINAHQTVAPDIDIDDTKSEFAGKGENEIRDFIVNNDAIESAQVSFWPFWVKKAPKNVDRIKIIIND